MTDFNFIKQHSNNHQCTEQVLLTSEELFRSAFEHGAIAIALVSLDGRFLKVNPKLCQLIGYTAEELLAIHSREITYPEDRDISMQYNEQTKNGGLSSYQLEKRYVHKNGSVIWGLLSISVVRTDSGDPLYFVKQIQDITCRKLAEKKLEESSLRYQSLVRHNPDVICMLDETGRLISANPAAMKVTGYSREELIDKNFIPYIAIEDWKKAMELFTKAKYGEIGSCEIQIVHKHGHPVSLEISCVPIIMYDALNGIYLIAKDISKRKQTEELLVKSEKLSIVGQIAAGVAHEIRNPLTALKGFTQLMQSGIDGKREFYDIMHAELDRIELIITEMLVLAKPHMNRYMPKRLPVMLNHVVALLETQAILNNIEIVTDIDPGLPMVLCEENRIKQMLINLLKNAMESMPDGGQIRILMRAEGSESIYVVIKDHGCGIEPDVLKKLGQPFFTTKEKGTGLGVMISFKIIEDHHGSMRIESQAGKGTNIHILLPAIPD